MKFTQGRANGSVRLLADQMVQLGYVESVDHETVKANAEKNDFSPWKQDCWVIPPEQNAEFAVCRTEQYSKSIIVAFMTTFRWSVSMTMKLVKTVEPIAATLGNPITIRTQ